MIQEKSRTIKNQKHNKKIHADFVVAVFICISRCLCKCNRNITQAAFISSISQNESIEWERSIFHVMLSQLNSPVFV